MVPIKLGKHNHMNLSINCQVDMPHLIKSTAHVICFLQLCDFCVGHLKWPCRLGWTHSMLSIPQKSSFYCLIIHGHIHVISHVLVFFHVNFSMISKGKMVLIIGKKIRKIRRMHVLLRSLLLLIPQTDRLLT